MTEYFAAKLSNLIDTPDQFDSLASGVDRILESIGVVNLSLTLNPPVLPPLETTPESLVTEDEALAALAWFEGETEEPPPIIAPPQDVITPTVFNTGTSVLTLELRALSDVIIDLSGLDGVSLVLNPGGFRASLTMCQREFSLGFTVGLSIRMSPILLRPMRRITDESGHMRFEHDESKPYTQINLASAAITIDSTGRINIDGGVGIQLSDPVMIGDSGVVIETADIMVSISGDGPHPEGTPTGWKGLLINNASIRIPDIFNGAINATGFGIGSGGVSGKIGAALMLNYNPESEPAFTGDLVGEVFGMEGGLEDVSLTFQQNIPAGGSIRAKLLLPFFERTTDPMTVDIGISINGGFSATLYSPSGILALEKPGLVNANVDSIGFGYNDGTWAATITGTIKPLFLQPTIDWPEVEVKALTIDSKGRVSIDGGWIEIPKQKSLDFHGFKLELTKIGFGKEADGSRWIGLSGGINIVEGIPLKGGVDGLKIIWKEGSPPRLEISGINVAFEVADVIKFDGKVFFIDEPDTKGFKGGIKMTIYPLSGMMLDAQFMAGRNTCTPPFNFFYLYIAAELPVGIPLGQSGISLYGMAGLFGYNVLPNKGLTPYLGEGWFENDDGSAGYYKRGTPGITSVDKWTNSRDSLALGTGITLGTADNGFTFSGKVLLVVLIPGMILVEGKAQFLQERKTLDEEPPFRLLAVLDAKAGTFLMNIDAKYVFPPPPGDGLLVDITGAAEAYFNFNNPNAWHVYLGQETPEAKRIMAHILSLYYAEAFFMMDAGGVRLGVRAGYNANWKFGPLRVVLQALLQGALGLSTKPVQAYGSLSLLGNVELKAFGKGMGLSLYTGISAQSPTPWFVRGEFSVKLPLPWPLPDPKATIVLEWKEETVPPIPTVLAKIGIEHLKVTEKWELNKYPVYDSDNDGFKDETKEESGAIWESSPIIPLDARPVLTFSKVVDDRLLLGDNPSNVPPAENDGEYKYRYRLKKVTLHKMAKTSFASWELVVEKSEEGSNGPTPLYGEWQVVPGKEQQNVKLMLWANTPFDISRELESNESWLYGTLDPWEGYPCNIDTQAKKIDIDFEKLNPGSRYSPALLHDDFLFFTETNSMVIVAYDAPRFSTKHGLTLTGLPDKTPIFENVCLEIKEIAPIEKQTEITRKGVVFKCATLSDGNPSCLSVMDSFPSSHDGRNEIYVGESLSDANPARYATINFPEENFPKGPHQVIIDCGCSGELILQAYDGNSKFMSQAQQQVNNNISQQFVLTGTEIRRIDIIGRGVSICELCYEAAVTKTDQNELMIVVPEPLAEIELYMSKGSKVHIDLFTDKGEKLNDPDQDFNLREDSYLLLKAPDGRDTIKAIQVSGVFQILKLSCLTEAEKERVDQNRRIAGHIKTETVKHWASHEGAYFKPNHYYKLTVATETERIRSNGSTDIFKFDEHAYFQTANPPGAYDRTSSFQKLATPEMPGYASVEYLQTGLPFTGQMPAQTTGATALQAGTLVSQPGSAQNNSEYGSMDHYPYGGPLKDLSAYIQYTIPGQNMAEVTKQAASNEPQRPAYRSYDIGVKFNEKQGYVEQMYLMADLPLNIKLYDNNSRQVLDGAGHPIELLNNWGDNPELLLTREEEQWKRVLIDSSCHITNASLKKDKDRFSSSLYAGSRQLCLKPQTLYKAKLCGGSFPVYEFSFVTSRYCTFTHHIHSFQDALWDHHKLLGSPAESLLNDESNDMLQDILTSTDIGDAQKFEDIFDLFALGIRQLPEQVEILLLNDGTRSYGLLLESPEPLDWERITLTVKYSSRTEIISEFTDKIKLIDANIDAQAVNNGDYNTEWVDILLIEQTDVSGLKIQHKKLEDPDFSDYFEFKDEDVLPAGTVIRIHSGQKPSHEDDKIEIVHRYTLAEGDASVWQFDPAGEVIQIVDRNDKILHCRSIIPYEDTDVDRIIIRSKDETRAFIFFPDNGQKFNSLENGRYRINFRFDRNKELLLKHLGSSDAEETYIEFSMPTFLL